MGVSGNLRTMALPDLLQWAGVNRKSGVLALERNHARRQLAFREGKIVACSTDDASLLGHYLMSAGRISYEQLGAALATQRDSGRYLGAILCEAGLISEAEVARQLALRAEETIFSLFEWIDADFSFEEQASIDASFISVDATVDEILLTGLQRLDEMRMIRSVFHSSGVVLAATGVAPPQQIAHSGMARRILASIDGERTLADVLALAQASDFLVLKFLYHLYHKNVVKIVAVRAPIAESMTLLDEMSSGRCGKPEQRDGADPDDPGLRSLAEAAALLAIGVEGAPDLGAANSLLEPVDR